MLKVLFTASGQHIGGATIAMMNLMLGLASIKNVKPILLSTYPKRGYLKLYRRLFEKNVKIIFSKFTFKGILYWLWLFFSSIRVMSKHEINIVHCHGTKEALIVGLAAKLLRKKIVYTIEGDPNLEIHCSPKNYSILDKIILKASWKAGLKMADAIVGCSKWMAEHLRRRYGVKAVGVHNPIDYERFSKIRGQGSSIVCIARFEKVKGLETLLRAVSRVAEKLPEVKAIIVGGGTEEENLRKLAKELSISENLEFQKFRPDVEKVLEKAAVFVLPSIYEPFGMAAAEALASGVPVIVSRSGGLKEIVEENINGFSFEVGNPEDLSEKIFLLIHDLKLREDFSRAARSSARRFAPENIALEYLKVYLATLHDMPISVTSKTRN